jgi:inorganic triphosphatase YgiF
MTPETAREIEAKYTLAEPKAVQRLAELRALGPYRLEPAETQDQHNTYFDTDDMRLATQQSGLRVREVGGRRVATVKTAGTVQNGLHERGEWEVELEGDDAPVAWPASPAREIALALTGGAPLRPIVRVRTLRHILLVWRDELQVAELALDEGVITAGSREVPFRELELELRPGGTRADLAALAGLLAGHAALLPEDRGKLARGLELLEFQRETRPTLAGLATAIFERTMAAHGLPSQHERLVSLAGVAYQAALDNGHESPWSTARDALLSAPLADVPSEQQILAASAAALLRERPRPRREPALLALRKKERSQALRLGALLRLAVALRDAGVPWRMHIAGGATRVALADEAAAQQVEAGAAQWRRRIGALQIEVAAPVAGIALDVPLPAPELAELVAAQPLHLAGAEGAADGIRRVLRRFFERLLAREAGVRSGEEREDVHQMRVATRRLRASLAVAEGMFDPALVRSFRRSLRELAAHLGAVRDDDVFLDALLAYSETLDIAERAVLDPLLAAVRADRTAARGRLHHYLASGRHRRFEREFAAFLVTPGAGLASTPASGPPRVRDLAGGVLWRRFEELRAFEAVLPGAPDATLHEARIAGKRLRYTLELFAEALGPQADDALATLGALQETLGALQDGAAAHEHVRRLGLSDDPGAQGYFDALALMRARQMERLPDVWERATGADARHLLLAMIEQL